MSVPEILGFLVSLERHFQTIHGEVFDFFVDCFAELYLQVALLEKGLPGL